MTKINVSLCARCILRMLVLLRNNCASNISFPFKGIAAHDIDVCLVEPIAGITFSLGKSTYNHGDG